MRSILIGLVVLLSLFALSHAGLIAQRTTVPAGWTMMGRADVNSQVQFSIGLHTQNDEELNSLFIRVTDPKSDEYLDYLSTAEMNARFGAREEDVQMVVDWLLDAGVDTYKVVHGAVRVVTTADIAGKLFNCEMRHFMHQTSGRIIARAWGKFSLPDEIHQLVEIVTGISAFPIPGKNPFKTPKPDYNTPVLPVAPDATEIVVPETVMGMYRIREQTPGSASMVSQGVIEYEGQYFSNTDTATFARDVGYTTTNTTIAGITRAHIVGTNNPSAPQIEAALDVEQMSSVNLEAMMWFWIEDGTGWLYEFGTHILNFTGPPMVTSTSYGWWEGDQCDIDPTECQVLGVDSYGYSAAVNKLFQKIGMIGTTLVVASGDSGANGRTNEGCTASNIRPEFPAASPYVTTVGATEIRNATYFKPAGATICANAAYSCIENGYEQAVSLAFSGFTSGGGFSNVSGATRQTWQDAAVTAYLNSGVPLPPDSYWNRAGRGEPDVAAVGHNGFTVIGGGGEPVGGTSMSSPIFGAIVSLLNYIVFTKTGNSLGFVNPLLYQMWADDPTTFTDITVGDNICPEAGCAPNNRCKGFVATKGWDPVTGLGTPVTNRMEAYVSKLADQVVERRAAKKAAAAAKVNRHAKKSRKQ